MQHHNGIFVSSDEGRTFEEITGVQQMLEFIAESAIAARSKRGVSLVPMRQEVCVLAKEGSFDGS